MSNKPLIRCIAILLTALTVAGVFPAAAMGAGMPKEGGVTGGTEQLPESCGVQVSMSYTPSSQYASGVYYQNLREVQKTGNQRLDIINAALSQVGYHEGDRKADLDGSNTAGSKNYTEYGYWFGKKVLQQSDGFFYEWCAMFVAWCARQAGVPKSVINNASYAHAGGNPYYFNVTFHSSGTYTPKPGDLIFYDWADTERKWDHVGIVLFVENGYVSAVEGNASEQVLIRRVSINNYEIQGYGCPAYTAGQTSALNPSNYTEPTGELSYGSYGSGVKWLQAALLRLGFPCPIDGSYSSNTKRQVKQFQRAVGLEATGVCTPAVKNAIKQRLGSGPVVSGDPASYPVPTRTLKKGMTGEDVKWLQAALRKMGASVTIDGDFGPATETKVKWAQKQLSLTQDGIVGPTTRNKIKARIEGGSSSGTGSSGSGNTYPVPTRTLKQGMSGNDVKWLQATLNKLGSNFSVTGYFGSATLAAVKDFQRKKGLTVDGIVGPATRAKLQSAAGGSQSPGYPEPTRVLRLGSTGRDVKWVQAALKKIGYAISVDGIFGTGTQNCVLAFQRSAGLSADGVVGPATRKALKARI